MDFADVCRVCLKNSLQYIDLDTPFEDDNADNGQNQECGDIQSNPFTYMDCFRMCTRLQIADDYDGTNNLSVPRRLCDTCGIELRNTYNFLQKAKRAHEILQEAMLKTKVEVNENEWRNDYESAKQHLGEDCKNKRNCTTDDQMDEKKMLSNKINEHSNDNTPERVLHTQETEEEFELVTVATSSTSTFDPLSMQKQNKKAVGSIAKVNVKDGVIKTLIEPKRRVGRTKRESKGESFKTSTKPKHRGVSTKRASKSNSIKATSTDPKRRVGPNEGTSKNKTRKKKMFLCHACPLTYQNGYAFRQHALAHEGKRERKLACEQCGKKFFSTAALQLHAKIHEINREPTFHCDKCDKSFFHYGSLYLHKRYHSEPEFECGVCGKRYVRQSHLDVHSRSHSGDLPYKCHKCDKAYQQVGLLNKHLKNYHDGCRYKCDVCGKEYKHQTTIARHYKVHTGMPFKCSICDKELATNYKIRRHIGGVHKIENAEEMDQFIIKIKTKKECPSQRKKSYIIINKNI